MGENMLFNCFVFLFMNVFRFFLVRILCPGHFPPLLPTKTIVGRTVPLDGTEKASLHVRET